MRALLFLVRRAGRFLGPIDRGGNASVDSWRMDTFLTSVAENIEVESI